MTLPQSMRILIADDHAIVRRGFQQIVASRAGWKVVGEASNAEELMVELRQQPVDVLVLDLSLGDHSPLDLIGQIAHQCRVGILVLSMHAAEQYALRCLRAGADGYIQKDSPPEEILDAIAKVGSGAKYITPALAEHIAVDAWRGSEKPHERLSGREFEVFRLIALGRSVSEIATMLNLSVKTVSTYRTRILEKTGFRSNAEMITYAIRNSLV